MWACRLFDGDMFRLFDGIGGIRAAAPARWREHTARDNLLTVGQAARRSGRDPHHVALSSVAALTLLSRCVEISCCERPQAIAIVRALVVHAQHESDVNDLLLLLRRRVVQDG
jgi:hypothetical protein